MEISVLEASGYAPQTVFLPQLRGIGMEVFADLNPLASNSTPQSVASQFAISAFFRRTETLSVVLEM